MTLTTAQAYAQPVQGDVSAGLADAEEIIVTGSRLSRDVGDQPIPTVLISNEELRNSGAVKITDYLSKSPALASSETTSRTASQADVSPGSAGVDLLDLRGLGVDRTLVLVGGQRYVAGRPGSAAVDVNTIPTILIDRVEIITGGASAVYGADAVSGAVNFILREKIVGIEATVQSGISSRGDGGEFNGSLVAGGEFAGGRGDFYVGGEYYRQRPIARSQRKYLREQRAFFANPADVDDDPNIPDRLLASGRITFPYAADPEGLLFASDGVAARLGLPNNFLLVGDGNVSAFDIGTPIDDFALGGGGVPIGFFTEDVLPSTERKALFGRMNYDVTDTIRMSASVNYVRSEVLSVADPAFDVDLPIRFDNAFLPTEVRDAMIAEGEEFLFLNKDYYELGSLPDKSRRDLFRVAFNVNTDLGSAWKLDINYNYGRNKQRSRLIDRRIEDRFLAAVDAVIDPDSGAAVCRSTIDPMALPPRPSFPDIPEGFVTFTPGAGSPCVAANFFGSATLSPEARAFINRDLFATAKIDQHVFNAVVTGDTAPFITLPGGPIKLAVGVEFRQDKASSNPDPVEVAGQTFLFQRSPFSGRIRTRELFGEISAPLLADLPFASSLTFSAAGRYSRYSFSGGGFRAFAWNVGGEWAPVRDIRFRATYAKSVRAPNIIELFSPLTGTFVNVDDPCDVDNVPLGGPQRAQNCAALGVPADFQSLFGIGFSGVAGGNPDLNPETARTLTAGVVVQPQFIPGLALSLDYYRIRLADAISFPDPQEVADLCVDSATIDNDFCALLTRDQSTSLFTNIQLNQQNIAALRTSGLEIAAAYRTELPAIFGDGALSFRLVGNRLLSFKRFNYQDQPDVFDDELGELQYPRWRVNLESVLNLGAVSISHRLTYQSRQLLFENEELAIQPDLADVLSTGNSFVHDARVGIAVSDRFDFYIGVNNITDELPPAIYAIGASQVVPVSGIGRYVFAGANFKF